MCSFFFTEILWFSVWFYSCQFLYYSEKSNFFGKKTPEKMQKLIESWRNISEYDIYIETHEVTWKWE